jgi:hypothetical protein
LQPRKKQLTNNFPSISNLYCIFFLTPLPEKESHDRDRIAFFHSNISLQLSIFSSFSNELEQLPNPWCRESLLRSKKYNLQISEFALWGFISEIQKLGSSIATETSVTSIILVNMLKESERAIKWMSSLPSLIEEEKSLVVNLWEIKTKQFAKTVNHLTNNSYDPILFQNALGMKRFFHSQFPRGIQDEPIVVLLESWENQILQLELLTARKKNNKINFEEIPLSNISDHNKLIHT